MGKFEINIPPTMIDPDGTTYTGEFSKGTGASGGVGGSILVINATLPNGASTFNGVVLDKTYAEIKAALDAGIIPVVYSDVDTKTVMNVSMVESSAISFAGVATTTNQGMLATTFWAKALLVDSSNNVQYRSATITTSS